MIIHIIDKVYLIMRTYNVIIFIMHTSEPSIIIVCCVWVGTWIGPQTLI